MRPTIRVVQRACEAAKARQAIVVWFDEHGQPDNLADMRAKRRHKNPPLPGTKLSFGAVCSVCERSQLGISQQRIAVEFGVSQPTISRVIRDHKTRQHACE
jgi:hypothetical protein